MLTIVKVETFKYYDRTESPRKQRVFFGVTGESVLDDLFNRHSRPHREYRKLLPQVFEAMGLSEDTKASWSQRAGCPCGCSPGFILDAPRCRDAISVTVTETPDS